MVAEGQLVVQSLPALTCMCGDVLYTPVDSGIDGQRVIVTPAES